VKKLVRGGTNQKWMYPLTIRTLYTSPPINLLIEISIKNDNITTTSHPLVLIKNGRLIALAMRYISDPIVALTCNTIK